MAIDCAGNLYVAVPSSGNVVVVSPSGTSLGTITVSGVGAVTNCAFGGTDHKTLYITAQGSGGAPPTGSVGRLRPGALPGEHAPPRDALLEHFPPVSW